MSSNYYSSKGGTRVILEPGKSVLNDIRTSSCKDVEFNSFQCRHMDKMRMDTLVKNDQGRFSVWPHPIELWYPVVIGTDASAQGAEHCLQFEEQLTGLEPIVKEFWTYFEGRHDPWQSREKKEEFKPRTIQGLDEYFQLLLKISIDCASQQMKNSLSIEKSAPKLLQSANVTLEPWDTDTISDDTGKPLLIVKHTKITFNEPYPLPGHVDGPVRLEMAALMQARSLTRFQGLYSDGSTANLRFVQVPDVDSIFVDYQSRVDVASYSFPEDRNGFVCHLVNLLQNTDDYEKYFKYKRCIDLNRGKN